MRYNHFEELTERATSLGYEGISEALIGLYEELKSTYKVADALGVSPTMVRSNLKKLGVERIRKGKKNTGTRCPECGGEALVIYIRHDWTPRRRHECRECGHRFTKYFKSSESEEKRNDNQK